MTTGLILSLMLTGMITFCVLEWVRPGLSAVAIGVVACAVVVWMMVTS